MSQDNINKQFLFNAFNGHHFAVRALLEISHADVNAKSKGGNTALLLAAKNGQTAIVELLLAAPGIDVNAKSKGGFTALIVAAEDGHTAIVELLLAAPGIDVNAKSKGGNTALIKAAFDGGSHFDGDTAIVELLLAAPGIDVNATNNSGRTALMLADSVGHTEIAYVIRTWGKGAYYGTGGIPGYFRSSRNIERAEALPFLASPTYQDIVQRRADSLDDGELSGNERVLLMLDKLGNNQRGDEEFPDEVDDGIARHDDLIRATDHVRSFLGRRDQGQLASVARRFNDPPLFPYLEEDPPYADLDDVPYAHGWRDYINSELLVPSSDSSDDDSSDDDSSDDEMIRSAEALIQEAADMIRGARPSDSSDDDSSGFDEAIAQLPNEDSDDGRRPPSLSQLMADSGMSEEEALDEIAQLWEDGAPWDSSLSEEEVDLVLRSRLADLLRMRRRRRR